MLILSQELMANKTLMQTFLTEKKNVSTARLRLRTTSLRRKYANMTDDAIEW
jgi:hypothetical protein